MEKQRERARELLPSIIITVLSMIQALALELYWSQIQESEILWQGDWAATLGWLQAVVILLGILIVWLLYVNLVLRFRWLPSMEDTLIPFGIGLLEFSMIDLMGPDHMGWWFIALAATFGLCTGASHVAFRRARKEPENDYFFGQISPAGWRDYSLTTAIVAILAIFGAVLLVSGDNTWLSLAGLLFALWVLCYQMILSHRYWMTSLLLPEDSITERVG